MISTTGRIIWPTKNSAATILAALILASCGGDASSDIEADAITGIGTVQLIEINNVVLTSLPESIATADASKIELGRLLFWDPILSGDSDVACATCHLPEFGYTDGRIQSVGVGGIGTGPNRTVGHVGSVRRNSQTILNSAWNGINELGMFDPEIAPMFRDNRTQSLAKQALEPIMVNLVRSSPTL